jgi:hypothetical protein
MIDRRWDEADESEDWVAIARTRRVLAGMRPLLPGLSAGNNCTISVTFTPAATGIRNGGAIIADAVVGSLQGVSFRGTGIEEKNMTGNWQHACCIVLFAFGVRFSGLLRSKDECYHVRTAIEISDC